jgi:hypothetical protein
MRHVHKELPAKVQFDPDTAKPAVISFEHGTLWAMAGSGSIERIKAAKKPVCGKLSSCNKSQPESGDSHNSRPK